MSVVEWQTDAIQPKALEECRILVLEKVLQELAVGGCIREAPTKRRPE